MGFVSDVKKAIEKSVNKPEKRPEGRPPKEFDPFIFEQMCSYQCTQVEIANVMRMAPDCLARKVLEFYKVDKYLDAYDMFSADGKVNLRRKQYDQAMKGDTTMLKHLGVHWLDQIDKRDVTTEIKPIVLKYSVDKDE